MQRSGCQLGSIIIGGRQSQKGQMSQIAGMLFIVLVTLSHVACSSLGSSNGESDGAGLNSSVMNTSGVDSPVLNEKQVVNSVPMSCFYVTQNGSGNGSGNSLADAAPIANFNDGKAPFDELAGDTVYFSGDFITGLTTPCEGSAGNLVTLDLINARFVGNVTDQVLISKAYIRVQNALLLQVADVGAVPTGINISGSNVQIDNCNIVGQGASGTVPYSSGIRVGDGGLGFSITRSNISHTCIGIWIKGLGFAGTIGGKEMGNTINHCNAPPLDGADGIGIGSSRAIPRVENYTGLVISHNTISEWNDDGIDLFYASNVVVEYNEIGPFTSQEVDLEDGNGIKCGRSDSIGGNVIRYNYVHDINAASGFNYGITTNGSNNITIISNYVYNARYGLVVSPYSSGHAVYNNTFSYARYTGVHFGNNVTSTKFQNNICDGGTGVDMMVNAGDRITGGYNLFVRDSSHNASYYINCENSDIFNSDPLLSGSSLMEGSPCIDAGITLEAVKADIRGASRPQGLTHDIGAFEWK